MVAETEMDVESKLQSEQVTEWMTGPHTVQTSRNGSLTRPGVLELPHPSPHPANTPFLISVRIRVDAEQGNTVLSS